MNEDALWLDGNAIAGQLHEAFAMEMTTVPRRCQSCGRISVVGAHRAYRGAGMVLRCPVCADVALRLVALPDRTIVKLAGTWTLELPRS
jgi:hypothetical protein